MLRRSKICRLVSLPFLVLGFTKGSFETRILVLSSAGKKQGSQSNRACTKLAKLTGDVLFSQLVLRIFKYVASDTVFC
jgi:hypothetical protein